MSCLVLSISASPRAPLSGGNRSAGFPQITTGLQKFLFVCVNKRTAN